MSDDRDAAALPVDSDRPGAAPPHLRPALILLVAAGGTVGTAAREAVSLIVPPIGAFPLAILLINTVGAFVLGLLLEALARLGPDVGSRRLVRLTAGTGFCGGFTTYSALAAAIAVLLGEGDTTVAVLYAVVTLVAGGLATWAGIAAGAFTPRPAAPR